MSFRKAFFQPFRLALGAAIFFLIFNPGIVFDIISIIVGLIFSSWVIGVVLFIILVVALDRE